MAVCKRYVMVRLRRDTHARLQQLADLYLRQHQDGRAVYPVSDQHDLIPFDEVVRELLRRDDAHREASRRQAARRRAARGQPPVSILSGPCIQGSPKEAAG